MLDGQRYQGSAMKWTLEMVPDQLGFMPSIEGLRGVALLLVIGHHVTHHSQFGRAIGAGGVSIFFTLSGFLITGILQDLFSNRERSFKSAIVRFYCDRMVRLTPPMLLVVPTGMIIAICWLNVPWSTVKVWGIRAMFYLENQQTLYPYHHMKPESIFDHFWSLACEEQFYILWAFILPLLLKINSIKARCCILYLGLFLGVFVQYRLVYWRSTSSYLFSSLPYPSLPANFYKMLMGSIIRLSPIPSIFFRQKAGLAIALTLYTLSSIWGYYASLHQPSWHIVSGIFSLATCVLLPSLIAKGNWLLETWVLRFIGRISYSLYLWHYMVMGLQKTRFRGWTGLQSVLISTFIATASTIFIEEPLRASYRRWSRKSSEHSQHFTSTDMQNGGYTVLPISCPTPTL